MQTSTRWGHSVGFGRGGTLWDVRVTHSICQQFCTKHKFSGNFLFHVFERWLRRTNKPPHNCIRGKIQSYPGFKRVRVWCLVSPEHMVLLNWNSEFVQACDVAPCSRVWISCISQLHRVVETATAKGRLR